MKQRIIKFRAWDKNKGKMHKVHYLGIGSNGYFCVCENQFELDGNCEIMQFTGLFDRNKKEIFEGDIVMCKYKWIGDDGTEECPHEKEIFEEVEFGGGSYGIICEMPEKDLEIIGNIYETPNS